MEFMQKHTLLIYFKKCFLDDNTFWFIFQLNHMKSLQNYIIVSHKSYSDPFLTFQTSPKNIDGKHASSAWKKSPLRCRFLFEKPQLSKLISYEFSQIPPRK